MHQAGAEFPLPTRMAEKGTGCAKSGLSALEWVC